VEAKSAGPGQGSEFILRLPRLMNRATAQGHTAPGTQPQPDGALRVMVVDDNEDAALMLATLLEAQGHNVTVEYDGRGALARARLESPQVMLLDIGLPGMDGYELARHLRAMPETAGAVLVALTGYGQSRDRHDAERAGFNHHLVKPADLSRLIEILAQAKDRQ
jgi:CheY-like chemotaxis protein